MSFSLGSSPLYAICDEKTCRQYNMDSLQFYRFLIDGGVKLIQYRNKISSPQEVYAQLQTMQTLTPADVRLIVNDYADVANMLCLPVHLGQDDKIPAPNFFFGWGLSTHNHDELQTAVKKNPDYIGYGAVFRSPTKGDVAMADVQLAEKFWHKEIVFIGGISLDNICRLPKGEKFYYALISDFFRYGNSRQNIKHYVEDFYAAL